MVDAKILLLCLPIFRHFDMPLFVAVLIAAITMRQLLPVCYPCYACRLIAATADVAAFTSIDDVFAAHAYFRRMLRATRAQRAGFSAATCTSILCRCCHAICRKIARLRDDAMARRYAVTRHV